MKSIQDIDWSALLRGPFHPSPTAWEDQNLYFLLVDRFSDDRETDFRDNDGGTVQRNGTQVFDLESDPGNAFATPEEAAAWAKAGGTWCGGNLRGLITKLGYLKRLGITALWVSPLLKQAAWDEGSYHGYGTQNFLEIDPHFGTKDDLRSLVATAHSLGMYVVLDIIANHTADVFAYEEEGELVWLPVVRPVRGFRAADGKPTLPFGPLPDSVYPDGGIWPRELQSPDCFTRKGQIADWDNYPEYEEGDFFGLKDVHLGETTENGFPPSIALKALVEIYKYWIAFADLDGFRLDTVKHMSTESVAYFTEEIHTFAESIGKNNFYIIGEVVGAREQVTEELDRTDLNAALSIGEIPEKIFNVITGNQSPNDYFSIFANSHQEEYESADPLWWRNRVVTFFDDHDQAGKDEKGRLASEFGGDRRLAEAAVIRAVGLQMLSIGIPCLYYGTEQGFDGCADNMPKLDGGVIAKDRFIRECLFGGPFGAFRSKERHCFNEETYLYKEISSLLALRSANSSLRRGRQYLREVSEDGNSFGIPGPSEQGPYRGIIAWSRILYIDEFVCAMNTDPDNPRSVFVRLAGEIIRADRKTRRCVYSTDPEQIGTEAVIEATIDGISACLTVPAGGLVVYQ
jgi:hypothetical protein